MEGRVSLLETDCRPVNDVAAPASSSRPAQGPFFLIRARLRTRAPARSPGAGTPIRSARLHRTRTPAASAHSPTTSASQASTTWLRRDSTTTIYALAPRLVRFPQHKLEP